MELAGDEKRIRALFSEQRFEDQGMAPSFDRLWNSARTTQPQRGVLRQPLAMLGALAMVAVAFALGFRSPEPTSHDVAYSLAPVELSSVESREEAPKKQVTRSRRPRYRRHVRPKEPEQVVIQRAEVLAHWQSPTDGLMQSAADSVFKSLPEFTQAVKDLESYLSHTELKELKQ